MVRTLLKTLLAFSLAVSFVHSAAPGRFQQKVVSVDGDRFIYQVFIPGNWSADRKWPVILFLHGAGERGSGGWAQTEVGFGPFIREHLDSFPAVVVMPQCRRRQFWNAPLMERQVLAGLEETIKAYNGDENRVYLTGLSMGGYGVFYLAAKYPGKFAALAPVAGGIVPPERIASRMPQMETMTPAEAAERVGPVSVWIFHGSADPVVPVEESRRAAEAMRALNGEVRYTEYEDVGHNSWDRAYSEPELIPWLLSKRRN